MRLLPNLIPEWKQWPKLWSVRFPLIGAALVGFADELPGAFTYIWALLPTDVTATIPEGWVRNIGIGLVVLGTILRAVKQSKLNKVTQ